MIPVTGSCLIWFSNRNSLQSHNIFFINNFHERISEWLTTLINLSCFTAVLQGITAPQGPWELLAAEVVVVLLMISYWLLKNYEHLGRLYTFLQKITTITAKKKEKKSGSDLFLRVV